MDLLTPAHPTSDAQCYAVFKQNDMHACQNLKTVASLKRQQAHWPPDFAPANAATQPAARQP